MEQDISNPDNHNTSFGPLREYCSLIGREDTRSASLEPKRSPRPLVSCVITFSTCCSQITASFCTESPERFLFCSQEINMSKRRQWELDRTRLGPTWTRLGQASSEPVQAASSLVESCSRNLQKASRTSVTRTSNVKSDDQSFL